MKTGVPPKHAAPLSARLTVTRRPFARVGSRTFRAGLLLAAMLSTLIFASSALAATASVGLGTAAPFSVLAGSTITNTGPASMFGDLGLSPGSAVTGAPLVLGMSHIDEAVAVAAKNGLTTAYDNAAVKRADAKRAADKRDSAAHRTGPHHKRGCTE